MKFPTTSDEFKQEVYISIDSHNYAHSLRYRQLKKILLQAEESIMVEGVLKVFEDKSRGTRLYQDQDFAGKLLFEMKPNTLLSLKSILIRTLPNYNLSVEEFPLYLQEKFGIDLLATTLNIVEREDTEIVIWESVQAFRYWLKI